MNYENLDQIAKLLGVEMERYMKAKEAALKDKSAAILEYLGYEDDGEIQNFPQFWYYYLADFTKGYFHNFGAKGYTRSLERFLNENNIEVNNVNYDDFENKEKVYSEILFDILLSEVMFNMKDKKNMDIIGINVGYTSNIYYFIPKEVAKSIRKLNNNTFTIYDFKKLEEIYGEIFRVIKPVKDNLVEVGEYIEKNKEQPIYRTLFDNRFSENVLIQDIDEKECLELVL